MAGPVESILRSTTHSLDSWMPETEADRVAIREHLNSILATSFFNTSKRYPAFLNYVVDAALRGRTEMLKERTLGIEVFHRNPMYDTSSDPVVRTAACEVRKRLGQYYSEFGQEQNIRIELPPGSYIPEFRRGSPRPLAVTAHSSIVSPADASDSASEVQTPVYPAARRATGSRAAYLGVAIALAIGIGLGLVGTNVYPWTRASAVDKFWGPLLNSASPVLICMGELHTPQIDLKPDGSRNRFNLPVAWTGPPEPNVSYAVASLGDSFALANLAAWLQGQRKAYAIQGDTTTTLSALGRGPAVLVGAFNNDWTIRFSDQLRYHFDMDTSTDQAWIVDRERPAQKLDLHVHGRAVFESEEYSLISRIYEPTTGQTVLALAGVAGGATAAAVEFVTNRNELEAFEKQAPAGWENRNIQVLIAVSVVDGSHGAPRVIATYVW